MSPEPGTLAAHPATAKRLRVAGIAGVAIVVVGVAAGIISRSATAQPGEGVDQRTGAPSRLHRFARQRWRGERTRSSRATRGDVARRCMRAYPVI